MTKIKYMQTTCKCFFCYFPPLAKMDLIQPIHREEREHYIYTKTPYDSNKYFEQRVIDVADVQAYFESEFNIK